jgi:hypothetical protein
MKYNYYFLKGREKRKEVKKEEKKERASSQFCIGQNGPAAYLKALQMIKFEQRNKHGIKTTKYLGA